MASVILTDLAALHDALGCASMAIVQAGRGDRDSASLSLTEARAAAEEAFGRASPGVDALNLVFATITQAAHANRPGSVLQTPCRAWNPFPQTGRDS
jgi:hypothetical protein